MADKDGFMAIDKDGNEIKSPDELSDFSRAYLQAIRSATLAYKIEHGSLSGYTGLQTSGCREGMEDILGIKIDGGILGTIQVCYFFDLVKNYRDSTGRYDPSQGHGTILTDKGWKYLDKWNI